MPKGHGRHHKFRRIERVGPEENQRNANGKDQYHHHHHNVNNGKKRQEDNLYNDSYDDEDDEDGDDKVSPHFKADDDVYDDDYYNDLVESLNNTKKAQIDVVFFNRCAKVGSQSLMELIARLAQRNKFTHSRNIAKTRATLYLKPHEQMELIKEIYEKPRPHIYSQHLNYINFTQFRVSRPIYINLVRDPIERIRSWFYYVRAEWYYRDMRKHLGQKAPPMPSKEFMQMDLDTCVKNRDAHCQYNQMDHKDGDYRRQTMFFCGQNRKLCMPFNSKAAMQKAKRTVEEDYAVVGTWEETNITLTVLEHYVPKFFADATKVYYEGKDHLSIINRNNVTRPMSEETRMVLRKNFTHEIEFYEFCKQRLYLQYSAINEASDDDDYDDNNYALLSESEDDDEDGDADAEN